jgi:hypothetical protein
MALETGQANNINLANDSIASELKVREGRQKCHIGNSKAEE